MSNSSHSLISYLRSVVGVWRHDTRTDAELLTEYAEKGDEEVFRALVWRHGLMVLRTCRRILGNTPDAEDAFQSAFLTLAGKAKKFPIENPAGWLHQVARRAALNIDAGARRRRELKQQLQTVAQPKEQGGINQAEVHAVLDEELARLPERLRVPLILRHLEGKTLEDVARILGCSRRALGKRLAQGEERLRKQMERRGMMLEVGAIVALLGNDTGAPTMPAGLVSSTARAAVAFRSGALSGASAEAAEKLLRSVVSKGVPLKSWWLVLTCVGSLGMGGAGLLAWKMISSDTKSVERLAGSSVPETKATTEKHREKVDCYGDPLPEGALARIGTIRLRPLKGCSARCGVCFVPDGKMLISSNLGFLYFWEWPSGKELRRSKERICGRKIAVSPDGKMLATGGRYWDIATNPPQQLKKMTVPAEWATDKEAGSVAFSSDGRTVAWAVDTPEEDPDRHPDSRTIYLVDAATGELKKTLQDELHSEDKLTGGWCLAFSSDNKTLAAGGMSGRTILWDVTSGKRRFQIDGDGDPIAFLAFLPDGKTLAESRWKQGKILVEGPTHITRFLDAATGVEQRLAHAPLTSNRVWCKDQHGAKCLSPDGKVFVLNSGQVISVWDLVTAREVCPLGGTHDPIDQLLFSPDSKKLVTLKYPFQVWDADTGRLEKEFESAAWDWKWKTPFAAFYLDTRRLEMLFHYRMRTSATDDMRTRWFLRWDAETGKTEQGQERLPANIARVQKSFPQSAASSDGRWLAVAFTNEKGSLDRDIMLVDRATGLEVRRFSGLTASPDLMVFTADGQSLLAINRPATNQPELQVWSTLTGERRMSLNWCIPGSSMGCSAISPDGRWLALASLTNHSPPDGFVHLLEVASGSEKGKFEVSEGEIGNLTWSNDGRLLAGSVGKNSNEEDREDTICLWDVATGQEIRRFKGHRSRVMTLVFSPDGLRLASGSQDTTVLIWDLCHLLLPDVAEGIPTPSADEFWTSLRKSDAVGAWRAMHLLTQHPDLALPMLGERLRQAPRSDSEQVAALLVQLDDDRFEMRERAGQQLLKMGETIEPALLEALAKKPSIEVQNGINKVLNTIAAATPTGLRPSQLQAYRGVAVLERIGTPAARKVLEELSRLPAETTQAKEAKAALQRLAKQVSTARP